MRWSRRRYKIDWYAHLSECDANYERLSRLLLDLRTGDFEEAVVSLGLRDESIHFAITESFKYTSVVTIVQRTPPQIPDLNIKVRIYHDTSCAEVVSYQGQRRFMPRYNYPNPKMQARAEKVHVNRFLGELLHLCLVKGRLASKPFSDTSVLSLN